MFKRFFRRPKPTASEAAQVLSRHAHLAHRERVKARAREMREQLGLAPDPVLAPRQ